MFAFAGNSWLCRLALKNTGIDPASFTAIRLLSGALVLWLIVRLRNGEQQRKGTWRSALALFAYAACFSFAYTHLTAATGALLLFGAVQISMILYGWWRGERMGRQQRLGFTLACVGLIVLLLPGLTQPPLDDAVLMALAGVAWGIYSLRGRGIANPLAATADNFLRTVPMALLLSAFFLAHAAIDQVGIMYAVASGALASALGYSIWYAVLPHLTATRAATVQLSVPIIAALGGLPLLGESISLRLVMASVATLGGVGLVIAGKQRG